MVKPKELNKLPIRYSGVFDLKAIYDEIYAWMRENQMIIWEKKFADKVSGPGIREQEVKLEGLLKYDEYMYFIPKIAYKVIDLKEITANGKPMVHGRISIEIDGKFFYDPKDMYEGTKLKQRLGKIMYHFQSRDKEYSEDKRSQDKMVELQKRLMTILGAAQ